MTTKRWLTETLTCLLSVALIGSAAHADWAQWRGPTRDGVIADASWPDKLDESVLKQVWRAEVGPGYPGPVVAGGRVFTAETRGEKDEAVRAFDLKTGEQLWEKSWPGAMKVPFFAKRNGSWIKATPAVDGERLFVMGMLDDLVCLDVKTGEKLWHVDFKERYGSAAPMFGQPCSPLVDGDAVYVQAGLSVCKLDKKTGETIWRSMHDAREMIGGNFSSPVIGTVAGKRMLLVQMRLELAGLDLDSGDVLWREPIQSFRGMNILPPTVVGDDQVFTSSYGGGSFLFKITANADGTYQSSSVWKNDIEGYMSSPLLIDGYLYLHGRDEKVRCIDVKTGEAKWTTDKKYGEYISSVSSGDTILALDYDATLRLIQATPDEPMKILAERKVAEQETWGHLAIDGEWIVIREQNALSVYRWAKPGGLD